MEEHIHRLKVPEESVPENAKTSTSPIIESTEVNEPAHSDETIDRPHSATYFEIPEWGELLLKPELDVNGIKEKIIFIESNLSKKLALNNMKVTSSSFKTLLKDIETHLQLDKRLHEPFFRVNKVYSMLKTIEETNKVSEERRRYLESILSR